MSEPSASDGTPDPAGPSGTDMPYLPPARPPVPAPAVAPPVAPGVETETEADGNDGALASTVPAGTQAEVPFLPSARPPQPAPAAPVFDAKAMVESQRHGNANPAYGSMPTGTDEGRAAARRLRDEANRKRRRHRAVGRIVGVVVLVAAAAGGYLAWRATNADDPAPADPTTTETDGEGGALTPLGEQEQVIEALDDVNSGARPSVGGLLDAVDDARDLVGQAEPPVAAPGAEPAGLLVADLFTPAVLDHTDVLDPADGYERFVVRAADLAAADPNALDLLIGRLLALPQMAADDPALAAAPVVLPGDIAIAIQRDDDRITRIVAVAVEPAIHAISG